MHLYYDSSTHNSYIGGCTNDRSYTTPSYIGILVAAFDSNNIAIGSSRIEDTTSSKYAYCRSVFMGSSIAYLIVYYSDLGTMYLGRVDYTIYKIYYTELKVFS
jgi:hypothetical protein